MLCYAYNRVHCVHCVHCNLPRPVYNARMLKPVAMWCQSNAPSAWKRAKLNTADPVVVGVVGVVGVDFCAVRRWLSFWPALIFVVHVKNVQRMSKECPKNVQRMSKECQKNVKRMSKECPKNVKRTEPYKERQTDTPKTPLTAFNFAQNFGHTRMAFALDTLSIKTTVKLKGQDGGECLFCWMVWRNLCCKERTFKVC